MFKAASFLAEMASLDGVTLALGEDNFECSLRMDEGEGVDTIVGEYKLAKTLAQDIVESNFNGYVKQVASQSIQADSMPSRRP